MNITIITLLNDIGLILGTSCITVLLLSTTIYNRVLQSFNYMLDIKPFNCAMCLGFWIGLGLLYLNGTYSFMHMILLAGITGISTELIDRVIIKL